MSLLSPLRHHRVENVEKETGSGLRRSVRLLKLFRLEQTDPERFYASLAEDTVHQVAEYQDLGGLTVVDVGGAGGWFTAAFRARGAHCYLVEPDTEQLRSGPAVPAG